MTESSPYVSSEYDRPMNGTNWRKAGILYQDLPICCADISASTPAPTEYKRPSNAPSEILDMIPSAMPSRTSNLTA